MRAVQQYDCFSLGVCSRQWGLACPRSKSLKRGPPTGICPGTRWTGVHVGPSEAPITRPNTCRLADSLLVVGILSPVTSLVASQPVFFFLSFSVWAPCISNSGTSRRCQHALYQSPCFYLYTYSLKVTLRPGGLFWDDSRRTRVTLVAAKFIKSLHNEC